MWLNSKKHKPTIGAGVLVKTFSNEVFYAIYTDEDEFDVHKPNHNVDSRLAWYKYTSAVMVKWRYFTVKQVGE